MLTKKRLVLVSAAMAAVYFALLWTLLPQSVMEQRIDEGFIFVVKVGFIGVNAAILTAVLLIFLLKRNFVKWQMQSFKKYRYLLFQLIKRDFVNRYRKSALGVLWSLLNPLITMIVLTIVFSHLFRFDIENFPVYLLAGRLIFDFFSESTTLAMSSITSGGGTINQVYVPKYIFPLSRVISSLTNVAFSLIAFVLVVAVTGAPFHWTIILIPIPIFYAFVFSLGIGMILSSLSVFFQDLTYIYGIAVTLLMFLTPIFYPLSALPGWLIPYIGLNPLFQFIDYFRDLTMYGIIPDIWDNMVCIALALSSLCLGVYLFAAKQDRFILYI